MTLTGYASAGEFSAAASAVFQSAMASYLGVSTSQVALSVASARRLLAGVTVTFRVSAVSTTSAAVLLNRLSALPSNPAAFMVSFNTALAAAGLPTGTSAVFATPTIAELVPPPPPSPAVAVVQPADGEATPASNKLALPLAVSLSGFFVVVAIIAGYRAVRARSHREGTLKSYRGKASSKEKTEDATLLNFLQGQSLLPSAQASAKAAARAKSPRAKREDRFKPFSGAEVTTIEPISSAPLSLAESFAGADVDPSAVADLLPKPAKGSKNVF